MTIMAATICLLSHLYFNWQNEYVSWAFEKAAAQGDKRAKAQLERGISTLEEDRESAKLALEAAINGDPHAQYRLYALYSSGKIFEKDINKAYEWLKKAAEQDYAMAQFSLGLSYLNGDDIPKNIKEGVKWYRKAGYNDELQTIRTLGYMYESGDNVTQDFKEAAKWFYKGALNGDIDSQLSLGIYYANGYGVSKDLSEAKYWINKAFENPDQTSFRGQTADEVWDEFELWKY